MTNTNRALTCTSTSRNGDSEKKRALRSNIGSSRTKIWTKIKMWSVTKNSDTLSGSLNIRLQDYKKNSTWTWLGYLNWTTAASANFLKKGAHQANVRRSFSSSEIHSSKTNLSHPFPLTRSSVPATIPLLSLLIILMFFSSNTPRQKIIPQFISRYKTDPNLPKNILIFFNIVSMRRRKKQVRQSEKSITEDLSNLEHFVFLEESKKCVFQKQCCLKSNEALRCCLPV